MGMLETIQSGRENRPPRIMIYGSEGVGKAQPLDAKILTPHGFVSMGSLKIGDKVIGADGKAHLRSTRRVRKKFSKSRFAMVLKRNAAIPICGLLRPELNGIINCRARSGICILFALHFATELISIMLFRELHR